MIIVKQSMSKEATIRIATMHDVRDILPLMEQLGYPQNAQDFEKRLEIFMSKEGYGVAVAEKSKTIIGLVAWSKSMIFVSTSTRIHIEGLIVCKQYRSQGVGKALLNFVENIAKRESPSIIDLTTGLRREKNGSHEFYKALGYKNDGPMAKLYLRKEV
jgi:GNAT superfamily N-acetyltransferase